jgi:hypothetical protein
MVAELLRDEGNGKVTVLGFMGTIPGLEMTVGNKALPSQFAVLIVVGTGPDAQYQVVVDVYDDQQQKVLTHSKLPAVTISPARQSLFAFQGLVPFSHVGDFRVRLWVNGVIFHEAVVKVS